MKWYLLMLILLCGQPEGFATIPSAVQSILVPGSSKSLEEQQPKFRWKRIFRVIRIAGKSWGFWFLLFGGIALLIRFLLLLAANNGGYEATGAGWIPILLLLLCLAIGALLLASIPFILMVRIIQELRWMRRVERCRHHYIGLSRF
ncbi:MAG TPA: hypothetical protein PKA00_04280 [Saprospiraceae bacterium]|nr:hypothetical protein [Saprospiraceae bacterium]HMQ82096.1 hypothetical protein [Saprospiraceae bacterium]